MKRSSIFLLPFLLNICLLTAAEGDAPPPRQFLSPPQAQNITEGLWKEPETLPTVYPCSTFVEREGIRPIFFDGAPLEGRPTRVFAWLGIPQGKGPFPGIVLIHGGSGTAYRDWVKLWMNRGYTAIAIDTCGRIPDGEEGYRLKSKRHEWAGPSDEGGAFAASARDPKDQWVYHAVTAARRARLILLEAPQVDREKIGITGISWGGVLTEITASTDPGFKAAAAVYGCGFLGENSFWQKNRFPQFEPNLVEKWLALWDPSQHIFRLKQPILFVNGTNDKFFPIDSWTKTIEKTSGPTIRSLRVGLQHGNPPHGDPAEVTVFMDSHLKGTTPLPHIIRSGIKKNVAWMEFQTVEPIAKAELIYTTDTGEWLTRKWQRISIPTTTNKVTATIKAETTVLYFSLLDKQGAQVSSPIITPPSSH